MGILQEYCGNNVGVVQGYCGSSVGIVQGYCGSSPVGSSAGILWE